MLSIIITAKDEAATIGRAIKALAADMQINLELIVVAPDSATLKAARKADSRVRTIQDMRRGKPAALNLAIREARGDELVLSDGDVYVREGAIKYLMDNKEDLISGRVMVFPAEANARPMYGFWENCLIDTAHRLRLTRSKLAGFLVVSGYLFYAKKKIFENFKFNEDCLTEDEYLSYYAWHKGFKIGYAARAEVYVNYPKTYRDWLVQKRRTLGGSFQLPAEWKRGVAMRSFAREAAEAFLMWKRYVHSARQAVYMVGLYFFRAHAWFEAFIRVKLLNQRANKIWLRVESTK